MQTYINKGGYGGGIGATAVVGHPPPILLKRSWKAKKWLICNVETFFYPKVTKMVLFLILTHCCTQAKRVYLPGSQIPSYIT